MSDVTTDQLQALLNGGNADALLEALAEKLSAKVISKTAPKYPHSSKADELVEASEYSYAKGRIYISADILRAAALALKNGDVQIVEAPEVLGKKRGAEAFVVFATEDSAVALQPLYKPTA